jgi:hypothetical protein
MTDLPATTSLATGWLDRRAYPDLHPEAARALRSAALCWHREAEAEAHLNHAMELAGGHVAVLIALYRYRLYQHRFQEAREAAGHCLAAAARRAGLAPEFSDVTAAHADFAGTDPDVRFWLFTLQAYGYVSLCAGFAAEGRRALDRLVVLDTNDQTKTRVLLQMIEAVGRPHE